MITQQLYAKVWYQLTLFCSNLKSFYSNQHIILDLKQVDGLNESVLFSIKFDSLYFQVNCLRLRTLLLEHLIPYLIIYTIYWSKQVKGAEVCKSDEYPSCTQQESRILNEIKSNSMDIILGLNFQSVC